MTPDEALRNTVCHGWYHLAFTERRNQYSCAVSRAQRSRKARWESFDE